MSLLKHKYLRYLFNTVLIVGTIIIEAGLFIMIQLTSKPLFGEKPNSTDQVQSVVIFILLIIIPFAAFRLFKHINRVKKVN